jgi:hypothetical protein
VATFSLPAFVFPAFGPGVVAALPFLALGDERLEGRGRATVVLCCAVMGCVPEGRDFCEVKQGFLADFCIPKLFVLGGCCEDTIPRGEWIEAELYVLNIKFDLESAANPFEMFAPHADICLVDKKPTRWAISRYERPDVFAIEVETFRFYTS